MKKFLIHGLGGKRKLNGTVGIGGAKNSALKAMAAALLFDGPVTLENIPDNRDIETMSAILERLGAKVDVEKTGADANAGKTLRIDASNIITTTIDAELAKDMRASVVLTGPLLARFGKAVFPSPGGCVIGARPIDLFLSGYERLGASVREQDCLYEISVSGGLIGAEIAFRKVSVGATETLMMAATLAKGTTVLKNCAREPEIVNVAEWLNSCGAMVSGAGTETMTIKGTGGRLLFAKSSFITIPDRITAGSFIILGAMCAERLVVSGCRPGHLLALTDILSKAGVELDIRKESITISNPPTSRLAYRAIPNVITKEYPGFPTDLQPPLAAFLTQCEGESVIVENIFEGRFMYLRELTKLGAKAKLTDSHTVHINGPSALRNPGGVELVAPDIRGGFSVVLAALAASGDSMINNVHLIDRGYERLEMTLKNLGADVERI